MPVETVGTNAVGVEDGPCGGGPRAEGPACREIAVAGPDLAQVLANAGDGEDE